MINLLPPTQRTQIKKEYRLRRSLVFLYFTFGAILVGALLLAPLYFEYRSAHVRAKQELRDLQARVAAQENEVGAAVRDLNIKLHVTAPGDQMPLVASVFLSDIKSALIEGIALTSILYDRAAGSADTAVRKATIGGVARDRQTLLAFAKKLDEQTHITHVDSPVSNLTKRQDLLFTVTFEVTGATP